MKVTVKLFATFRIGRDKIQVMDVKSGTTPMEIITALEIPPEEVKILLVNGQDGTMTTVLAEGDVLAIFPPVGGG